MYDRYKHWGPFAGGFRVLRPLSRSIEEQVLTDLAGAKDNQLEKLEILDSFGVYKQRCYRVLLLDVYTQKVGDTISSLVGPFLDSNFPEISLPIRAAAAQPSPKDDKP